MLGMSKEENEQQKDGMKGRLRWNNTHGQQWVAIKQERKEEIFGQLPYD